MSTGPTEAENNAFTTAAYLRITSLAIAAYDYLETQPTSWRFYKEHYKSRRLTISAVLYALLRFVSICTLTVSSVGFFYGGFTLESCSRFFLLPPSFKVLQAMVTQAILGIRAFNLSRRSKRIGWLLLVTYWVACTLQWITTLYQRTPKVGDVHRNCRAANQAQLLGAWIFYAIAIIYDVLTTSVSIGYLLKYKFTSKNSMMTKLSKMMLYDGLGYLVVLIGVNVLNLILFREDQDIQTAGASLGYCVSWIMSQRLLIHLYDASRERNAISYDEGAITVSKQVTGARDVSRIVRTNFGHKSSTPFDLTRPDSMEGERYPDDLNVEVRIERTIRTNNYTRSYELEDYSRSSRGHVG